MVRIRGRTRRTFGDQQRPYRFGERVTRLRLTVAAAGQRSAGSLDGVELIGLAVPASLLPVRTIDLDHRHRRSREMAGDTRAVRAGALDTNTFDRAEPAHPHRQTTMPVRGRAERLDTQQTAVHIDDRGDVHVAMRVDPAHDRTR